MIASDIGVDPTKPHLVVTITLVASVWLLAGKSTAWLNITGPLPDGKERPVVDNAEAVAWLLDLARTSNDMSQRSASLASL